MRRVFNIILCPKTSWSVVACNLVWYVLRTDKSVATGIPYQGSYSYRYVFVKLNVRTIFSMTGLILSNIEFTWLSVIVLQLDFILYSFLVEFFFNAWPRN